jgi:hypothetical protein
LSRREESTNGGQSRWLANGECGGGLPQGGGESSGKGEALATGRFYSWRREGVILVPHVGAFIARGERGADVFAPEILARCRQAQGVGASLGQ